MGVQVHTCNVDWTPRAVWRDEPGSQHMSVCADVVGGWDDVEVGYLLGRGSSGSVYRAKCKGQHVAVKVCSAILPIYF